MFSCSGVFVDFACKCFVFDMVIEYLLCPFLIRCHFISLVGVSIVPEINFRGVRGHPGGSKSVQYDTKLTFCPILGQVCL